MKKVVDTDGNEYEHEEVFLTHVLDVVGKHLNWISGWKGATFQNPSMRGLSISSTVN